MNNDENNKEMFILGVNNVILEKYDDNSFEDFTNDITKDLVEAAMDINNEENE